MALAVASFRPPEAEAGSGGRPPLTLFGAKSHTVPNRNEECAYRVRLGCGLLVFWKSHKSRIEEPEKNGTLATDHQRTGIVEAVRGNAAV
jgi:hypothetical protein